MMMMTSMLCLFFLQSLAIASSTIATSSSDSISSSNVIVDNVSDDEHPNIIQIPITDSITHTSPTSSSRKIKDITTNNKQKQPHTTLTHTTLPRKTETNHTPIPT